MSAIPLTRPQCRRRPHVAAVTILSSVLLLACGGREADRKPKVAPLAGPAEPVAVVFDVPSLVGKSIDEIRQLLGDPGDTDSEPSRQQLDFGADEWNNTFTVDGHDLLVTFNPRTRTVVDLFLDGDDQSILMQRANLTASDTATYRVEAVKALRDRSQITGIRIIPKS